jgi:exonuclease 3'-5' domain-containing protein 1
MPTPQLISDAASCRAKVHELMEKFENAAEGSFLVAVDLEGREIGPAEGRVAIVQVGLADGTCYLFDIAVVMETLDAKEAFVATGLKELIEHPLLPKLWFDPRADSAALFHHDVKPRNVIDLQVWANLVQRNENIGRPRQWLTGLAKCLDMVRGLPSTKALKDAGVKLFAPEHGGSYDVFFERPMNPVLVAYCGADVAHLFALHRHLASRYATLAAKVKEVGARRVDRFSIGNFKRDRDVMTRFDF